MIMAHCPPYAIRRTAYCATTNIAVTLSTSVQPKYAPAAQYIKPSAKVLRLNEMKSSMVNNTALKNLDMVSSLEEQGTNDTDVDYYAENAAQREDEYGHGAALLIT